MALLRPGGNVVEATGVLRAGGEDDAVARVEGTKLVTTMEVLASRRGRKKWPEARWSSEIGAGVVCFLLRANKRTRGIRWCAKGWGNERGSLGVKGTSTVVGFGDGGGGGGELR